MKLIRLSREMTIWAKEQRSLGKKIGLVPTMGCFHEGHLSLMRMARKKADKVIVSLFVNPIQFGPKEDLGAYPRDFERDSRLAKQEEVDVLFVPDADEMYPQGYQTTVSVSEITRHLCGMQRPGHFDGVATVLTKLFNITSADLAVFGEKDYQQLAVIRRMKLDLNMDIDIEGYPIVREQDGLAMSSRNTYLDAEERQTALCLSSAIALARDKISEGLMDCESVESIVRDYILSFPGTRIDYADFVDNRTLEPVVTIDKNTLLALAVKINDRVRLIDNGLVSRDN